MKVCYIGIRTGTIFKRKMADLETNIPFVILEMENALGNRKFTIQNLILKIEELKNAKERNEVNLAILDTNIVKEPMKCKPKKSGDIQGFAYTNPNLVWCDGELSICW
jgi:hypothetical protein